MATRVTTAGAGDPLEMRLRTHVTIRPFLDFEWLESQSPCATRRMWAFFREHQLLRN
jgi:hypothetical protein